MIVSFEALDVVLRAVILSTLAVFWVIMTVRLIGLRAFSKMTAFDFVVTVATGSLLAGASQATQWSGFWQAALAISTLLGVQWAVARVRLVSPAATRLLQNEPVVLMKDGVIFEDRLSNTRVTRDDLIAKLREANALQFDQVRAVVLETTGNISVLHGPELDDRLLEGVKDPA